LGGQELEEFIAGRQRGSWSSPIAAKFRAVKAEVERWQATQLSDSCTKLLIYQAFIEKKTGFPKYLARRVHDLYCRLLSPPACRAGMHPKMPRAVWGRFGMRTHLGSNKTSTCIASGISHRKSRAFVRAHYNDVSKQRISTSPFVHAPRSSGAR
jgi:hypothetical protein